MLIFVAKFWIRKIECQDEIIRVYENTVTNDFNKKKQMQQENSITYALCKKFKIKYI